MPLPQQVIEQLGKDSEKAPGWSSGILLFSGGIFALVLAGYVGLILGYEPYLNNAIAQTQGQITTVGQSISSADQAKLLDYYSQIANLNTVVSGHVVFSQFLTWLELNTEANVYYGNLNFSSGNQVTLSAFARTQADVNEQIATFESLPDVSAVSVPGVAFAPTAGMWAFNVTLTLDRSLFLWQAASAAFSPTLPISTSTATSTGVMATSTKP